MIARFVVAGAVLAAFGLGFSGCSHTSHGANVSALSIPSQDNSLTFDAQAHRIYCSNFYPAPPSITEYDFNASGDAHPVATIAGAQTGILASVAGLALDSGGFLYVTNSDIHGLGNILVFAPGANGDVAPVRTITAASYGGIYSIAIAIDASDNVWIANYKVPSIEEFAAGANGDVAPIRTISGSATQLVNPTGIAVGERGDVWIADDKAAKVMRFGAGASGNATPKQVISGSATNLTNPFGIALTGSGALWVSNVSFVPQGEVYGFHTSDNGNVAPSQSAASFPGQYGENGGPAYLNGKLVYPGVTQGQHSVIDVSTGSILVPPAPVRSIFGPDTGLISVGFVAAR